VILQELQPSRSPDATRGRILAATRQLLGRKGRRGTTTREIAELAGVNEATLFRHFGHKDALVDECVRTYCGTIELRELAASLNGDLAADLRRLAEVLTERMESARDLIIMSLVEEEEVAMSDFAWRTPAAIKEIVAEYMAKRVAAGDLRGNPFRLARFFMGMVFAHVIGRKRLPDEPSADSPTIDFLIGIFLNGTRLKP